MSQLDLICPAKPDDFDRLNILYRSLHKFLNVQWRMFIIHPWGSDLPEHIARDGRCVSLFDHQVLPDMPRDAQHWTWSGWWVQQAIKLAMVPWIETPYCLAVDADCILTKSITLNDLADFHGRVKTNYGVHGSWDNWYAGSARILGTPVPPRKIQVTPFTFATPLLKRVYEKLLTLDAQRPWTWLLEHSRHANDECWTEYCLYHCWGEHLEQGKVWERYHVASQVWMYGNSAWTPEQADAWDAAKSFLPEHNENFLFTVVQSVCKKDAAWVWERVQPYLEP